MRKRLLTGLGVCVAVTSNETSTIPRASAGTDHRCARVHLFPSKRWLWLGFQRWRRARRLSRSPRSKVLPSSVRFYTSGPIYGIRRQRRLDTQNHAARRAPIRIRCSCPMRPIRRCARQDAPSQGITRVKLFCAPALSFIPLLAHPLFLFSYFFAGLLAKQWVVYSHFLPDSYLTLAATFFASK